jgi:hypothetical protein
MLKSYFNSGPNPTKAAGVIDFGATTSLTMKDVS